MLSQERSWSYREQCVGMENCGWTKTASASSSESLQRGCWSDIQQGFHFPMKHFVTHNAM